jgi:hypothetical protein
LVGEARWGSACDGWGSPCDGWGSACDGWGSACDGWGSPCDGWGSRNQIGWGSLEGMVHGEAPTELNWPSMDGETGCDALSLRPSHPPSLLHAAPPACGASAGAPPRRPCRRSPRCTNRAGRGHKQLQQLLQQAKAEAEEVAGIASRSRGGGGGGGAAAAAAVQQQQQQAKLKGEGRGRGRGVECETLPRQVWRQGGRAKRETWMQGG